MKRVLVVFIILILFVAFVSCTKQNDASSKTYKKQKGELHVVDENAEPYDKEHNNNDVDNSSHVGESVVRDAG